MLQVFLLGQRKTIGMIYWQCGGRVYGCFQNQWERKQGLIKDLSWAQEGEVVVPILGFGHFCVTGL